MKINPNYKMRQLGRLTVVVNQGTANVNMTRIISLNKSASRLYKELADKEFTLEDAAKVLMDSYDISRERAMVGAEKWVNSIKECGVLEDE